MLSFLMCQSVGSLRTPLCKVRSSPSQTLSSNSRRISALPIVLAPPCGHGVNSPISQFERLITAQPQRGSGRGCRRNLCPDNRLSRGLWMWCASTHCVSLSAGGLAPKVGGNDSNEELQDGEDGQHGKVAPAHILRTQTHSKGKQSV